MALLIATSSVDGAHEFVVEAAETVIGRSKGLPIRLEGTNISRRHARILRKDDDYWIEDLGSSNGTFLNEKKVAGRTPLTPNDILRIGSYTFRFGSEVETMADLTIQSEAVPLPGNTELYAEKPVQKLQAVLQLAHDLGNTLELDALLNRFFTQVLKLFPRTDRAIIIFLENAEPVVRLNWERRSDSNRLQFFSKSLFKRVTEQGIAVLAADTGAMEANKSVAAMGIRSILCVPLTAQGTPVFGAIQLERFRAGDPFTNDDLHLLTAVTLQASMALDKSQMHQRLLGQDRIAKELALAREIQLSFLPHAVPVFSGISVDLLADLKPAVEVSGDFYDYIRLDSTRLLIAIADVSGKGVAAALFMSMVRALLRQVIKSVSEPAEILRHLNEALAQDNSKFMFVTMIVAVYDVSSGHCVFARAGHPAPLIRFSDGEVRSIESHSGCLLGIPDACSSFHECSLLMTPGDLLILYTDGITEAAQNGAGELYGEKRFLAAASELAVQAPLHEYVSTFKSRIDQFCAPASLQDDLTLLLLRHQSNQPVEGAIGKKRTS
jgi:sigma-B regulation protein RsbU (phosphoserine phosphatase)